MEEDWENRFMILSARVKAIEDDYWTNLGRLEALQIAVCSLAREQDFALRLTLLEDLSKIGQATHLALAITDDQLDRVTRARELMLEALRRAFEQALLLPEFREPPPRRA